MPPGTAADAGPDGMTRSATVPSSTAVHGRAGYGLERRVPARRAGGRDGEVDQVRVHVALGAQALAPCRVTLTLPGEEVTVDERVRQRHRVGVRRVGVTGVADDEDRRRTLAGVRAGVATLARRRPLHARRRVRLVV